MIQSGNGGSEIAFAEDFREFFGEAFCVSGLRAEEDSRWDGGALFGLSV